MAGLTGFKRGDLPQSEVILIPIVDVSGSMDGAAIGAVNDAMRKIPDQLRKINDGLLDTKLLIAPMQFASGAKWLGLKNGEPFEPEGFVWQDLKAWGGTDLGAAFNLLREKLTVTEKGGWMKGRGGYAPVLILISDGEPTDDYRKPLKELQKRGWFNAALKFAIGVEGADKRVLAEFTGNSELVWEVKRLSDDIEKIVRTLVVTASKTASKTSAAVAVNNVSTVTASADTNQEAKKEAEAAVVTAVDASLNDADDWSF